MAFPEHGVPGAWRSRSVSLEDCIAFLFIDMVYAYMAVTSIHVEGYAVWVKAP